MASIFGLIKKRWSGGKAKDASQNEDGLTLKALTELKENLSPEQYAEQSKKFSSLVKEYFQRLYKIRYKFTYEELIDETGKKRLADDLKVQITSLLESLINTEFDKKSDNPDILLGQILSFEEIIERISCIKEVPKPESKPGKKEAKETSQKANPPPMTAPEKLPAISIPLKEEPAKSSGQPAAASLQGKKPNLRKTGSKLKGRSAEGTPQSEEINNLYGLFSKAYEALSDEDLKTSKQIYSEITSYLKSLDEDSKSEFSDELETLEGSISQLESEKQAAKLKLQAKSQKKLALATVSVKDKSILESQPSSSAAKAASAPKRSPKDSRLGTKAQAKKQQKIAAPALSKPKKEPAKKMQSDSSISHLPPQGIIGPAPIPIEEHETAPQPEASEPLLEEAPDLPHKFEPPTFKHLIDKLFHKKEVVLEPTPIIDPSSSSTAGILNNPEPSISAGQPSEEVQPETVSLSPGGSTRKLKLKAQEQEEPTEEDIEKLALSHGSKQLLKESLKEKKKSSSKGKEATPASAQPDEPLLALPALDTRDYLTLEEFTHQVEQKNSYKEKEMTESISPFDRLLARFGRGRKAAEPQADPQELPRISAFDAESNQISSMVDNLYEQINAENEQRQGSKRFSKGQEQIAETEPQLPSSERVYLSSDEIESLRKISGLLKKIYPLVKKKELGEARKLWQEVESLQNNLSKSTLIDLSGDVTAIGEKINQLDVVPPKSTEENIPFTSEGLVLPPPPPPEESGQVSYTSKILSTARSWKAQPKSPAAKSTEKPAKPLGPVEPKPKLTFPAPKQPKEAHTPPKEELPEIVAKPIKKKAVAPTVNDLGGLINSARAFISQGKLADARQAYENALRLKKRLKLAPDIKSRIDYELMDLNVELRLAGIN